MSLRRCKEEISIRIGMSQQRLFGREDEAFKVSVRVGWREDVGKAVYRCARMGPNVW